MPSSNSNLLTEIPSTVSASGQAPIENAGEDDSKGGFFHKLAKFVAFLDPAQREQARTQALSNLMELGTSPDPVYQKQYETLLQNKSYLKQNRIDKETATSIQSAVAATRSMMTGMSMTAAMMRANPDLRRPGAVGSLLGEAMPYGSDVLHETEKAITTASGITEKQIGEAGATTRQGMKDRSSVSVANIHGEFGKAIADINGRYRVQGDKIRAEATVEAAKLSASARGLVGGAKKTDFAFKTYNKFSAAASTILKTTLSSINAKLSGANPPSADEATAAATQSNLKALSDILPWNASTISGEDPEAGARSIMSNLQNSLIYFSPGDNKAMTLAQAKAQAAMNPSSPEAKAFYDFTNQLVKQVVQQASGQIDSVRDYMSGNTSAPVFIDSGAESPDAPNPYAGETDGGSSNIEQPAN